MKRGPIKVESIGHTNNKKKWCCLLEKASFENQISFFFFCITIY